MIISIIIIIMKIIIVILIILILIIMNKRHGLEYEGRRTLNNHVTGGL